MKILIITMNIRGGMIHYVSQMANSLSKTVDVVVIAPEGVEKYNFEKDVKIIELKMGNILKNFLTNTLILTRPYKFLKVIYEENPDIIHFNENHLWTALLLPFLKKFNILTMVHDIKPHPGRRTIDQKIAKKLYYHFSDCLLVHGEYAKKELKTNKKCCSIPHGDYSFFLNYQKGKIEEESETILFFGNIVDYKGLDYLIKSINYISKVKPKIKLIIAGSGDFENYKSLVNDVNFEIHNRYINDEEVPYFFQRAKLVVLPYIECTQTGIIPIAYAFKKPVIVTDVGSIPEVVEDGKTGIIIPPKNPILLSRAITKILDNENLRKQMGINGYIKMEKELSWDSVTEKLIKIYYKMMVLKCY